MAEVKDPADPKGLIRESFRIEGITSEECRSIFLDWALSIPVGQDTKPLVEALLVKHADDEENHPMKAVLRAALDAAVSPKRRGGRAARMNG